MKLSAKAAREYDAIFGPSPTTPTLTRAQREALTWLAEHNGTGVFDKNGVLLAGGELAPHTRSTWNKLRDLGQITITGKRVSMAG